MFAVKTVYVAALVHYDGTDFFGFQYQPNAPTIQGVLEDALLQLTGCQIRISGSGRTDTGVHARGQVVGAEIPWRYSLEKLFHAWNAFLPASVSVQDIRQVSKEFHPRYRAGTRTYRYTVVQLIARKQYTVLNRAPLTDRFSLFEHRSLDIEKIREAAALLIGKHDFATFGRSPQGNNTVRCVSQLNCDIVRTDLPQLGSHVETTIVFTITANAFLRKMVRNIVGTLLEVGRGHRTTEDVKKALLSCDRSTCSPPVPPKGLVLERVSYPDFPELF